jgi:Zn ribbon nucleic-acid-binding protein
MTPRFSFRCHFLNVHETEPIGWELPATNGDEIWQCVRCGEHMHYTFLHERKIPKEKIRAWERQREQHFMVAGSYTGWWE